MTGDAKILLLCPYPPGVGPSQRFRFEQYLETLKKEGFLIKISPFLDHSTMQILYRRGFFLRKAFGLLKGFLIRVIQLFTIFKYDLIFIHREASPVGPPIFEFLLFKLGKKVIYDFDDAIFIEKTSKNNKLVAKFKFTSKVSYIVKNSWKVAVCNQYLVDWVRQYNNKVFLIPTTIDLNYHTAKDIKSKSDKKLVIGWTGTQSTMIYLDIVRNALARLEQFFDFEFMVICDVDPLFPNLKSYKFVQWQFETEIEDLAKIDIGLMPVPEGLWEKGKVGFKAIQYSGVGAVPVVSSVGSGREVVLDGVTGFAVENDDDSWFIALSELLNNAANLEKMGLAAREYIDQKYSVRSQIPAYINLLTN